MLEVLTTDEFIVSLGTHSTPNSLRRALLKSTPVQEIRKALLYGKIDEEAIRRFLATIMKDFKRGEAFVHEIALAAIAVSLEGRNTQFAEEYLIDLAGTSIAEFGICRRVAGLSAQAWLSQPNIKKISPAKSEPYKIVNRISRQFRPRAVTDRHNPPETRIEFRPIV